jgi:hypothetical protein
MPVGSLSRALCCQMGELRTGTGASQADQDSGFLPNDRFSSPISLPPCEHLYKSTGLSFIRPLWMFVDLLESFDTSWGNLEE